MCKQIKVQMLGGFSIHYGEAFIDDNSNRMKKVWLLLAYLIFCRSTNIPQEKFLSLIQKSGDDSADPNGKMKAMFHRTRTLLNQIDENAGHNWITRKNGTYAWNTDIPLLLDTEEFESLYKQAKAADSAETRLELYQQALALYKGDFLPKLSAEPWVMPIHAYFHQIYINIAEEALVLMESMELWEEILALCEQALRIEPYSETFYQHLMRAHIAGKNRSQALIVYEEMYELLFSTFGVMPSEESRALFREASRPEESTLVPPSSVREELKEPMGAKGALYCEYDFFKLLYQVQARSILRSGDVIHIALFSVHAPKGKTLARKSIDLAVSNLQNLLANNLRQGDVITKCSISQLLVMLPQANYENSCAVCQRILKAFHRQYPHTPVEIHYSVQPLEPLSSVPHPEV